MLSGRASEERITKLSRMEGGTGLADGKRTGPGRRLAGGKASSLALFSWASYLTSLHGEQHGTLEPFRE